MTQQWTRRYLALLGIERSPPSLPALSELIQAHVLKIPFENVTSLLRWQAYPHGPVPAPDLSQLMDAWESRSGGGLCFEICAMLVSLLHELGYQAHIVLGQISVPFGHQAVLVELDGRRYLLDPGNGAPLFAPIALDSSGVEVHRHGLSYRFRYGDDSMKLIQDRMPEQVWTAHCHYDLDEAHASNANTGYQNHHTANASWVTGTLTMVRSTHEGVFALRDNTFTQFTEAGKQLRTVEDPSQYRDLATNVFGLPDLPIVRALQVRETLKAMADS